MKQILSFTLNGLQREVAASPTDTLLDVLREDLGLTGAKRGCDCGDCGACTVILDGEPVRACLTLALTISGKSVTTVEGLAKDGKYHPIQEAFMEHGAFQCGFCTAGMILSSITLLAKNPKPTRQQAREYMAGNLCRCGSYEEVLDAILAVSQKM
jgi:carbon-monoxide dehydrogenase small subunit